HTSTHSPYTPLSQSPKGLPQAQNHSRPAGNWARGGEVLSCQRLCVCVCVCVCNILSPLCDISLPRASGVGRFSPSLSSCLSLFVSVQLSLSVSVAHAHSISHM